MNEESKKIRPIVVTTTKSVGISLILTILFGPLGMLYSTIWGGVIMLILSAIIGFLTLGYGLIFTWIICIIWGAIAVTKSNKNLMDQVSKG